MADPAVIFLLDKSAHEVARRNPHARRRFESLATTGLLATCAMVELEILYSARNRAEHQTLRRFLREQCIWLETSDEILVAAIDLQEQLLEAGTHRKPLPDLIIASVAMHHDAVLVHRDRDFEDIAKTSPRLRHRWIVDTRRR